MNIAVISFTEDGRLLSEKLAAGLSVEHSVTRYCAVSHADTACITFERLRYIIAKIFGKYNALIFVSAVGIAVRAVAPHIVSKLEDPAVIAIDDCGRFAVSVLSGHIGGANELAKQVARITGAVPVITTSTDAHGVFSPDNFAKENGLVICDAEAAKKTAAALINGETVGVKCRYRRSKLPKGLEKRDRGSIGICVSGDPEDKPFDTTLNLMPHDLIVGIGCKKGTSCDAIAALVVRICRENGLDMRRLYAAATINIKADESGLLGFCELFGLPLKTFTARQLMKVKGEFAHSDFVERTTGADNICERAAVCAGGRRLFIPKTSVNGVTAAIAQRPIYINFEKE